jgi:hypothetical protein
MTGLSSRASRSHQGCSSVRSTDRGATRVGRFGRACCLPVATRIVLLVLAFGPLMTWAQDNSKREANVRPCTMRESGGLTTKKPVKRKAKSSGSANPGEACLEVRSSSLSLQEELQSFVREQKWRVGDEDIGESFWSFSVVLSKEELLDYAKPDSTSERVQWSGGKAIVSVRTTELNDGYTRATVSGHFEGFGEPGDTLAIQRASWTLISNGKLEAKLTHALQAHFGSPH